MDWIATTALGPTGPYLADTFEIFKKNRDTCLNSNEILKATYDCLKKSTNSDQN